MVYKIAIELATVIILSKRLRHATCEGHSAGPGNDLPSQLEMVLENARGFTAV